MATIGVANYAPVAVDDPWYSVAHNTELVVPSPRLPGVVGVKDNDWDPEGDAFSVSWHDQPAHGSLTVNPDGSFTYMPTTGYEGADAFHYRVSDAWDESTDQEVTITVVRPLVDVDTDSDNNGALERSQLEDDHEMPAAGLAAPGKILRYNDDDDNANQVKDYLEAPLMGAGGPVEDDELYPLALSLDTRGANLTDFTLQLTVSANLRLWDDLYKEAAATLDYTIGTDTFLSTLYVEGHVLRGRDCGPTH